MTYKVGDRVRVTTTTFDHEDKPEYSFSGRHGNVTSVGGGHIVVTVPELGPFPFLDHEIEPAKRAEVGDTVLIASPSFPYWNGEAVVDEVHKLGYIVRPVAGPYEGIAGYFAEEDVAVEIPVKSEPEAQDELRTASVRLSNLAGLAAEASAYATALADTLDEIEASVLS